jgi:hypothetical protein
VKTQWIVKPAAEIAIAQRGPIADRIDAIQAFILKRNYPIVFAGVSGAGKSVLADYLSGRVRDRQYQLPRRSEKAVKETCKTKDGRLGIVVWPGQDSPARAKAINDTLGATRVVGLVYVVSYGLTYLWQPAVASAWANGGIGTIKQYQERQRDEELKAFREVSTYVKLLQAKDKLSWIIVAVTKADIWWPEVSECYKYYEGDAQSPFVDAATDLIRHVGSQRLRFRVMPVSTSLEPFVFGTKRQPMSLGERERNGLVNEFIEVMGQLCEAT